MTPRNATAAGHRMQLSWRRPDYLSAAHPHEGSHSPCPQVEGDDVICMSGYQGYEALAIPLTATGDISGSEQIRWSKDTGTPYVPSAVLYDGLLYFNQAILRCVDSISGQLDSGPQRVTGISNIYASPVAANG